MPDGTQVARDEQVGFACPHVLFTEVEKSRLAQELVPSSAHGSATTKCRRRQKRQHRARSRPPEAGSMSLRPPSPTSLFWNHNIASRHRHHQHHRAHDLTPSSSVRASGYKTRSLKFIHNATNQSKLHK
ncbi:hypothetical protein KC19_4G096800 [Ceratodon purpureus]|uniref:Uncharacterized protein n=1 Tax=Ceratodon purpureus TaxID=3225 RepID=A0A8T0I7C2_CERPU|nr:hypothetical protein KC19_4G096800 [Ceratodon purpureus]